MITKTNSFPWPAHKSCHNKRLKARESEDLISLLPDEVMLSIVSSLPMKEIASLSCVSHRWEFIWRCAPLLIFEDSRAMEKINKNWEAITEQRSGFVRWVDRVVEKHLGTVIDELRITFDLDHNWQSHVDKWAAFAIDKHVQRLEFNFKSYWRQAVIRCNGVDTPLCGEPLELPPKLNSIKSSSLKSLRLKDVNATDEFVDNLSHSCPLLEALCIVRSGRLIKLSGSFRSLKHLKVKHCRKLKKIDISAHKLCSFVHFNDQDVELHFSYAPSLTDVSVGLSHLAYLSLSINSQLCSKVILGIGNPAYMPNLRHLELIVLSQFHKSLQGWVSWIAAAPYLQKLTLKLYGRPHKRFRRVCKWDGFPLKCLKTLELCGYAGRMIDLELAFYVFENATMLEEVIVGFDSGMPDIAGEDKEERLGKLRTKLPQAVKLIIE